MFLKNFKLTNFRNFSKASVEFSKTTILLGNNAQGKSNLLEAIYFLATVKSSRAQKDIQLIEEGEGFARVEGKVLDDNELTGLEIVIQNKDEVEGVEKRVKVNGISRRIVDYIGNLAAVYFTPEDINLVTGSPSLRRSYLDLALSQIDKSYKKALNVYTVALVSKNRVLKRIQESLAQPSELDFWTLQMIESGKIISEKRKYFFTVVNKESKRLSQEDEGIGEFRFSYQANLLTEDRSKDYQGKELAAGMSLIGPHRDDFIFQLKGRNLAYFGSRGEQRTAVLELKLAELAFVNQTKGITPVLLLDDVFSELDENHRQYIIAVTLGQQTILSVVDTQKLPQEFLKASQVIRVEKGKLTIL